MSLNDWESIANTAEKFIKEHVASSKSDGVVFGLSGGVDSAVTAHLCCRALGPHRCMALLMPNSDFTPSSETDDGMLIAKRLGIPYMLLPIENISNALTSHENTNKETSHNDKRDNIQRRAVGNLNARIRSVLLYYEAQKRNYLVVGTDDRSEHLIGYFTKYGDGACDILPIADLYKTQIWQLARHLGISAHIIDKEPSPHLWKDHSISTELGMDYKVIDTILSEITNMGCVDLRDADIISTQLGTSTEHVKQVIHLNHTSEHKRHTPPIANLIKLDKINATKNDRSWGSFESFALNAKSTVKMITVNSGASIPLCNHRSGFWKIISGHVIATLDDKEIEIKEGDSIIPTGKTHKLAGGNNGAKILEISIDNFSENDTKQIVDKNLYSVVDYNAIDKHSTNKGASQ